MRLTKGKTSVELHFTASADEWADLVESMFIVTSPPNPAIFEPDPASVQKVKRFAELIRDSRSLLTGYSASTDTASRTCILTGAAGEDADDCTTHDHEKG